MHYSWIQVEHTKHAARRNERRKAYISNLVKIFNVRLAYHGGEKTVILSAPSDFSRLQQLFGNADGNVDASRYNIIVSA